MTLRARLLLIVGIATLVPALLFVLRFVIERDFHIEESRRDLLVIAGSIARDIEGRVRGATQLHYGLALTGALDVTDRAACSALLAETHRSFEEYTALMAVAPDGMLACDSLHSGREVSLTDRQYFKDALLLDEGVTLQPTIGRLTGRAELQVACPVRSEDGTLRFVLVASLDLAWVADAFRARHPELAVLFFDRNGTVLVWLPGDVQHPVGSSIAGHALFEAAQPGEFAVVSGLADDQAWAVADLAPAIRQAGLTVMVAEHRDTLAASANSAFLTDMAIIAVVSLLFFSGVWALTEFALPRQIGRISAMVQRLGRGNLDARIPPPFPRGELGDLMATLNSTAESLERQRDAIADLNQQLRQAQKMEAVGQLTGGVAHDFNNLLTVIIGNLETLGDEVEGDRRLSDLVRETTRAAGRGAELTSRLLAFARRQPLAPRVVDINRLLASIDGLIRRTLASNIALEVVPSPIPVRALVDPAQLEAAILNLCINARDAMPEGGKLTLETANVELDARYAERLEEVSPGRYVLVAVSDSGSGMDKATLERAFEPFFTTKEPGRGSGLGLSMVFGFVKQSRGHVRIYSEPGHGTTVKIYLPRSEAPEEPPPAPRSEAPVGGKERILVVEDDPMVREHVAAQLVNLGYEIVSAAGAHGALEILRTEEPFDLLFTDVVMPGGMGGRQLAEEAKRIRPGLRVLFTSGYTANAIIHHGRLDPNVNLLQKPYRRSELAAKIREALDGT